MPRLSGRTIAGLLRSECGLTPEQPSELETILLDVNACIALLPAEERAEHERCRQSVIDARRDAERHAYEHWTG